MNEVVKLISPQNVSSDVLSKNALLADYVDWDSRQSFDDFCLSTNVKYQSNDFCILAKKDILDKLLKKEKSIYPSWKVLAGLIKVFIIQNGELLLSIVLKFLAD